MKSLILLSGGIDSAVCAALCRDHERRAIGFNYGQPHAIELEAAARFADVERIEFSVIDIPFMGKVNDVVFAGRNAVLLTVAASIAASDGFSHVVIGTNASDHIEFPDTRPAFLSCMNKALSDAYGVRVSAPLQRRSKTEVVGMARDLGLDLDSLWTCYEPRNGRPCGECYSCRGRRSAGA